MSYMSRNNSSTAHVGFSVHQPALGAALQFFPAMGTKQLDEMINAYVPGNNSIQDKRAEVSMEFYQHVCQTGDMFKFFMVSPSPGSTTESPASSMVDSGYASSTFTSPIMSESQWTQGSGSSFSSTGSHARRSSHQKATSPTDFSHLPGMKIMTRDGKDVTNSASRGCKTKEQRDHAHLMRVLKACEACRKKKVRCDPSHKRTAGSSGARTTKKAKKAATSAAPPAIAPQPASEPLDRHLFDPIDPISSFSFDSTMPESFVDPTMEWDQFIQYNEEPNSMIPVDYDFLYDPAGYFSPTSNSLSYSQPIMPAQTMGAEGVSVAGVNAGVYAGVNAGTAGAESQVPLPPYLNPGGEAGNDYADFNLYSPGSSSSGLDDDPALIKDLPAPPRPDYNEYLSHQRLYDGGRYETLAGHDRGLAINAPLDESRNADGLLSLFAQEETFSPAAPDSPEYYGGTSHRPSPSVPTGTTRTNSSSLRISPISSNGTALDTMESSSAASLKPGFGRRSQPFTTRKSQTSDYSITLPSRAVDSNLAKNGHETPCSSPTTVLAMNVKQVRTSTSRGSTPASSAGLDVWDSERPILATGHTRPALTSVATANVFKSGNNANAFVSGNTVRAPVTDTVVNVSESVAPLSRSSTAAMRSGILSAVAAVQSLATRLAVFSALLGLALDWARLRNPDSASLCHEGLSQAASETAQAIPILSAPLLLLSILTVTIFKRRLPFLRRLPTSTTVDDMKPVSHGPFGRISSIASNARREDSFRPFNGAKGMISRLSHTTRPIII